VIARNQDLFVVAEGVGAARATLASNLETAVNAVWDSGVTLGQSCLVVGFGIIGSLVARLLAGIPGVTVAVSDCDPSKTALATELGFSASSPERIEGPFDLAFHASATSEGLQQCIDTTGFEGTIVEASWYATRAVQVELGRSFHSQRKRIISTQVSTIPPLLQRRWSLERRKQLVFELLRDPAFDRHITETVAFADLPAYYNAGGLRKPGLARVVDFSRSTGGQPCTS
jgi:threonine dehydrogenase-like Zn-dependent dehydrogenase